MSLRAKIFNDPRVFRVAMSLYPPFLGAGIRVTYVAADFTEVRVALRASKITGNAFGTHFGGSLYAMTDPFFALMMAARLGRGYVVWDKAAQIDFVRPGVGTVTARFVLDESQFEQARAATADGGKFQPVYRVNIINLDDEVVARVTKTLYIRKRQSGGS